jgi:hypothetical protein
LEALEASAQRLDAVPLRASVLQARAAIDEANEDLVRASTALVDAADLFERGHAPYEAAMARIELARVLDTVGRTDDARRERARGHQQLHLLRS